MRRLVVGSLLLAILAGGGAQAYRSLARDYRYFHLIRLGDQLLTEDLPFQASRTYGAAIGLKKENPIAYVKRAEAEKRQGHLQSALEDLEVAASLSADVLLVSTRLGDLCTELERFEEAAAHYRKALSIDPESPMILYKLGLVHFRQGEELESIAALSRATALREGFWQAYYLRGAVSRTVGDFEEAEADLVTALEHRPDAHVARQALIELYLERAKPERALPLVQAEIDSNPGAARPYLHLAHVHRLAGRTPQAIEAVGLALEQDPDLPAAYLRLGELWLEEARRDELTDGVALEKAISALESAAKMEPANGRAALALGRAYLAMGDEARGFAELQRASRATPVEAEAHRLLGDLYSARSNFAEAVTAYHVYLKLSGDLPPVLERLGDAYLEVGKAGMASEIYAKWISLEPRRTTPVVKAARASLASGDASTAAILCERGLAMNPESRTLLSLLAQARARSAAGPP